MNNVERELQSLLSSNSHELDVLDKRIKGATENAAALSAAARSDPANTTKQDAAKAANEVVVDLRAEKKALKSGDSSYTRTSAERIAKEGATATFTNNKSANGKSINQLEDHDIPDAHHAIEKENRARKVAYAERIQNRHGTLIGLSKAAARGIIGGAGAYKLGVGTIGLGALAAHPVIGGVVAAGILAAPLTQEDKRGNREAAHKIIMDVKLDSGVKH